MHRILRRLASKRAKYPELVAKIRPLERLLPDASVSDLSKQLQVVCFMVFGCGNTTGTYSAAAERVAEFIEAAREADRASMSWITGIENQLATVATLFPASSQHAWVSAVAWDSAFQTVADLNEWTDRCVNLIVACDKTVAQRLANAKDRNGRRAVDVAIPPVQRALQKRLLFLDRFKLAAGPPIHRSATCVVMKAADMLAEEEYRQRFRDAVEATEGKAADAIDQDGLRAILKELGVGGSDDDRLFAKRWERWDADCNGAISEAEFVALCKRELDNNQCRQLVFKFMKEKDQFQREVVSRRQNDLDPRRVISVLQTYDSETDAAFREAVAGQPEGRPGKEYKYAIVMLCADRNLLDAIMKERFAGLDRRKVVAIAADIALAIKEMHDNGLAHGDIKVSCSMYSLSIAPPPAAHMSICTFTQQSLRAPYLPRVASPATWYESASTGS